MPSFNGSETTILPIKGLGFIRFGCGIIANGTHAAGFLPEMLTLKTIQPPPRPRRRRGIQILMLAPLFVAPFFVEHFRGGWLLKAQAREMAARGEPLDSTNLWPEISAKSIEFSKSLDQVVSQVSPRLRKYAGAVTACMPDNSGNWHRGSQMPWPVIQGSSSTTSWEELGAAIEQDHVAVQQLRELMKNPPAGVACKLKDDFELNSVPNFVQVRVGAQILQAAAMNDLHNGNSALALEDILAMRRFTKLYAADPSLVSLMIRIAIVGIASDVCWDALQAKDWSEEKLERVPANI